ncbi:TIGR04222 domain-containing membrane protein [Bradyrhizobium sp. HKCCYLS20291]|uniref:TIGR04222 domain-containing membrane protein n=1 Tax=Bradyrhizobium sp. HKCCYLS20291 TaxID=3420766 RepID=UPI003EBE1F69
MALNPFDWTAGPFLLFYVACAGVLFFIAFQARHMIGPAATTIHPLTELDLAYLAGGPHRLGDVVLLGLAAQKAATLTPRDHKITVSDKAPLAALIDRPPQIKFGAEMSRHEFQRALVPLTMRVEDRLRAIGYAPTGPQMTAFRSSLLPFVGALLLFGVIKVVVGAARHHSVEFLLILLAATCFVAYISTRTPTRTRAGSDALRHYETSHARIARAPREHELLMAVALSGAMVLSGTAYASVLAASKTSSSGSGCSGGGCGGGGGGCGGCS